MIIHKEIEIPFYFCNLIIVLTNDWKEVDSKFSTNIDEKLYDAVVFQVIDNNKYVIAIKKIQWSIIAHEVVHIVNLVYLSCGIELDIHNDENQAYFTGWIVNEIDVFLKENTLQIVNNL